MCVCVRERERERERGGERETNEPRSPLKGTVKLFFRFFFYDGYQNYEII